MIYNKVVNALNKIILKTAVSGLVWTAVIFSYGIGIFSVAFPRVMADFADAVGDNYLRAVYYERIYKQNPTNENLYYALDKFIAAGNSGKIIKYGEKMFALNEYTDMIDAIDDYKKQHADGNTLVLSLGCNEDDRLRCNYIKALLKVGGEDNFETAQKLFDDAINAPINLSRPSYAIYEFVGQTDFDTLWAQFVTYFRAFESEFAAQLSDDKAADYFITKVKQWSNL